MLYEDLNDREKTILRSIVQQFILTASPVGSRNITKRFDVGVSPATVRNIMSDLEENRVLLITPIHLLEEFRLIKVTDIMLIL